MVQTIQVQVIKVEARMMHQQRVGQQLQLVTNHSQGDQGGQPHGQNKIHLLMHIQGNNLHISLQIFNLLAAFSIYLFDLFQIN